MGAGVSIPLYIQMANKKRYIKKAHSKNPLRIFTWNKDVGTVFPNYSTQAVDNMINDDPVARGALTHFIDKCMEGEYNVIKRETLKYDRDFELLLDEKYQFRANILRKIFTMGKLYNNIFIEIIRDTEGKTKDLNVLDTRNVDTNTNSNGDPIRYKSKVKDATTGKYAEWDSKDIVWIKVGDRSTGWAPLDMAALYENLMMKSYIKRYVAWLWKTGQYRLIHNFKNASDKDVEDFLVYGRKHDDNFKSPFIMKGEYETKMLRDMKETDSLELLLKYLDGQTLILLRVPPIDAGIPDASGRSNSDAQSNNLATHVTSFKKLIEDKINFALFPAISKGNSLIRFAPVDRFAEKQVFETVQMMQSMGMTPEVMEEYLADRGMFWKATLFKPELEMSTTENPRDLDSMPSRIGKGEGEANKKIGTGEQATTREEQL